jgi:hypothetical protein
VKEESQIEDMRAAVKGDRERAEARRRSTENVLAAVGPATPSGRATEPEQHRRRSLLHRLLGR